MYRANLFFSLLAFLRAQLPKVNVIPLQEYKPIEAASLRFPTVTLSVEDVHDAALELGTDTTWYVLVQNYVLAQNFVQEQGMLDAVVAAYRTPSIPIYQLQQGGQLHSTQIGSLVLDKVINSVDVPLPKDTTVTSSYYFVGSLYTRFLFYLS